MTKKQSAKDTLIVIKSVEETGWPTVGTDVVTLPPLGSVDRDGNPTSESSGAACEVDASFKKSKPYAPGFEILYGHTTVSFSTEPDKVDTQDTSRPKRYTRGHDTYSGSLDFDKIKDNNRIEGAVDGYWDPDKMMYQPDRDFKEFEIWTLVEPDSMSLNATGCKLLVKHYGIVLDKVDESRENIVKLSVPISRTFYQRFPDFTFPTSPMTMFNGTLLTGKNQVIAQPREHTRLVLVADAAVGSGQIIVYGTNIFKEPVTQVFDVVAGSSKTLGFTYFDKIDYIYKSATITGGTFELKDYDFGLTNPDIADY